MISMIYDEAPDPQAAERWMHLDLGAGTAPLNLRKVDPLARLPVDDFPFDQVAASLGEATAELDRGDRAKLGQALRMLLSFLCRARHPESIGRRTIALAWVINPELVGGVSLARLAKGARCSKAALSHYTAQATKRFRVKNRAQSRGDGHRK